MSRVDNADMPLITVIITNYNYGIYIEEAINSVLNQTYPNIELIIINDGSTDDSDDVICKIMDVNKGRNIRYVNRENKGVVYTRNEGLELAKGEYVSYLDADDYFNNDYIMKSYQVSKDSGADVVYPNWHFTGDWLGRPDTNFPEFSTELLQLQKLHCTPASLVRKKSIGNIRFRSEKVAEDWDFFIGLSLNGVSFKLAKSNYINYRIRQGTRSSKNDPREDTKHFVEILEGYRDLYRDRVINPVRLIRSRHPNILIRLINNKYSRRLYESIKKDGLISTIAKLIRKAVSGNSFVRRLFRFWMNSIYKNIENNSFVINKESNARLAVVVHLYYPDLWPQIAKKLSNIDVNFDLFISEQKNNNHFDAGIISDYHNNTYSVKLPNRGRDVLPFFFMVKKIKQAGVHDYLLKLHTKKSPHRDDGNVWFNELIDELIPNDISELIKTLKKKSTGVIGPSRHVVSLSRYMGGSRERLAMLLSLTGTPKDEIDSILANADRLPFFGGTMFWSRVDFLDHLVGSMQPADFDREKSQVDSTTAHAVERFLGRMYHNQTNKEMFIVGDNGVDSLTDDVYDSDYKYVG